ncbi:MAG: protein-glutamate O-methyltransferase CheR [Phycisphaerales bacterium]|nr:protein-glutamate O-methyltransferase CheR [Phycisphaerales bacterium]
MELKKLTIAEFKKIASFVYEKTGIHLEESKLGLLSNRLRKRLRALKLDTFNDYFKLIQSKEGYEQELPHFLSAVTTNETYFFRNEKLWEYFSNDLIPNFIKMKGSGSKAVRIWSAASSTGAEAYTAAILLRELLPNFNSWNVRIIGTDISKNVLDAAKAGVYNTYALSKTSKERVERWFKPVGDDFELKDEIKKLVTFQFHNLRDKFPNGRFDLIFLRNVLMYFDNKMKKQAITVVSDALAQGGHLIIGDVDPIRTIPELNEHMKLDYIRPGTYFKPGVNSKESQAQKQLVTK